MKQRAKEFKYKALGAHNNHFQSFFFETQHPQGKCTISKWSKTALF